MADSDRAFVGRCKDCGKLHAAIVVTPRTAGEISRSTREMEDGGLVVEQATVAETRSELVMDCHQDEVSDAVA